MQVRVFSERYIRWAILEFWSKRLLIILFSSFEFVIIILGGRGLIICARLIIGQIIYSFCPRRPYILGCVIYIMNNKKGSVRTILLSLIIVVFLIWGFVGGQEAQSSNKSCDLGIGESLCWKWRTSDLGEVKEIITDTAVSTGHAIKVFFED
jgi:hypothetical protein